MTENATLRQLVGLPDQPAAMADSTLIMIDCQNTYTKGVLELEGVQPRSTRQRSCSIARAALGYRSCTSCTTPERARRTTCGTRSARSWTGWHLVKANWSS